MQLCLWLIFFLIFLLFSSILGTSKTRKTIKNYQYSLLSPWWPGKHYMKTLISEQNVCTRWQRKQVAMHGSRFSAPGLDSLAKSGKKEFPRHRRSRQKDFIYNLRQQMGYDTGSWEHVCESLSRTLRVGVTHGPRGELGRETAAASSPFLLSLSPSLPSSAFPTPTLLPSLTHLSLLSLVSFSYPSYLVGFFLYFFSFGHQRHVK